MVNQVKRRKDGAKLDYFKDIINYFKNQWRPIQGANENILILTVKEVFHMKIILFGKREQKNVISTVSFRDYNSTDIRPFLVLDNVKK